MPFLDLESLGVSKEELKDMVNSLATAYYKHLNADNYQDSSFYMDETERIFKEIEEKHGKDFARYIDRMAYSIGHG